jgi:hypothetical protein
MHWLSYWHRWFPWFTTVSYISWWPEHGIVNDRQGIRDRGGAYLTTFAEFPRDKADTVLYWLDYLNNPAQLSAE